MSIGVPELLVHIQLDYEIEKRIKILRELQRAQEIYEYELRYSVAYHSTHRSEHEEVEMSTKVERDQRVEVGRREKEKKEEDKEGVEEEIRRGGGEERRGSGGGRGSHTGGNHIIYGGRRRTLKIDKTDVEMTDSSNQMKFEKEKELKAENIIRINEIKKHLEIIEILKATQRGLLSYIRAVSMNNGATWVEASDRIKKNEENMKSILQLTFNSSFYDTLHLSSTSSSSSSSSSSSPNSEKHAEESVQDSLKLLSSDKICSLSQFAPITIPTDSLIDHVDSAHNDFLNFDEDKEVRNSINEGIEDFPLNSNNFYIRPILDVVGIKINSFKNSVSAIKMFLSARIKVNNI